jgi:putative addiction module component (TIGR02574 family)
MSATMKSLGIDQLSVTERILLMEEIWDSIAESPDQVPLTHGQKTELDARLAEYQADPSVGATWEEVKGRLWSQP